MDGKDGTNGQDGKDGVDGVSPVITIQNGYWYIDGVNTNQKAQGTNGQDGKDGVDGRGIQSIELVGSEGLVDIYALTFTDGEIIQFIVTNGKDGVDGKDGTNGQDGKDGVDGSQGAKGDSYNLTEEDKKDIANIALGYLPIYNGEVDDGGTTSRDFTDITVNTVEVNEFKTYKGDGTDTPIETDNDDFYEYIGGGNDIHRDLRQLNIYILLSGADVEVSNTNSPAGIGMAIYSTELSKPWNEVLPLGEQNNLQMIYNGETITVKVDKYNNEYVGVYDKDGTDETPLFIVCSYKGGKASSIDPNEDSVMNGCHYYLVPFSQE